MASKRFYVYLIKRLNGTPLYVGKGQGRRAYQHKTSTANVRLRRIYARDGDLPIQILREDLTDREAKRLEKKFIRRIGRADLKTGPLCNLTEGGDGMDKYSHSEATRKKLSEAHIGMRHSEETILQMTAVRIGKKHSKESRLKISAALKGRTFSKEARLNMSLGHRAARLARMGGSAHG